MVPVRTGQGRAAGIRRSGGEARPVETLQEAGLAQVLLAEGPETLGEGLGAAVPLTERPQVGQDGHCFVVLSRFLRLDEDADLLPRGLFPPRQVVQALLIRRRTPLSLSGLLFFPFLPHRPLPLTP